MTDLELSETMARIERDNAEAARKRQETELAPRHLMVTAITAAAGLLAAGAAIATAFISIAVFVLRGHV